MNKQQRIVAQVRKAYEAAHKADKEAQVSRAADYAGAYAWDQYNDQVCGFPENPFDLNRVDTNAINSRNHLENMREAYEFAVDTFLGDDA